MQNDTNVGTLGSAVRRLGRLTARLTARPTATPSSLRWRRSFWRPELVTASLSRTTRRRIAAVALALAGILPAAEATLGGPPGVVGEPAAVTASGLRTDQFASRGWERDALAQAASPAPPSARAGPATPSVPVKPSPVVGLNQTQMDNAAAIVAAGKKSKLPKRAQVIAVATAMQESRLLNLANPHHPESLRLPNQGVGYDFDSLGLFQQRPASGWGSPRQLMNAEYASKKFYAALVRVPGWDKMSLTAAAQTVQGSAFPDAYAQHEAKAQAVVDALSR